jgi:eukaryotic-like serine/threonine-protein kinase
MATIVGKTLLNQFRVDSFVASGGMGAVYRVWDLKRNVPLAMKVLHSELADDPVIFKRFRREANALKKLAHPNIVPFYGLYHTLDIAFLLERFVDGPALGEILRRYKGKPMPLSEVLIYLKALCAALGYAHANGVVHCDVKPGNVMIDRGGTIYLTDFGIARHAESTTTTMGAAGTPAYMAPEQISGKKVSRATDVYALGVMLFEMLTGQRPFRGTEAGTEKGGQTANERIRYGQLNLDPPDPLSLNPDLPAELSAIILKTLSKQPEARYDSVQSLFAALCSQAGTTPSAIADCIVMQSLPAQTDDTGGQVAMPGSEPQLAESHPLARKWSIGTIIGVGLMAVVVLGALAGGVLLMTRANHASGPAGTSPQSPNNLASSTSNSAQTPVDLISAEATIPPTETPTITPTPTNTVPPPTPTLGIMSTWTRPKDGMVMIFVPAGEFSMGTNEASKNANPQHKVKMEDYWIDRTDVTNAMFQVFIGETGYKTDAEKKTFGQVFQQNGNVPKVNNATWNHPRGPKTTFGGLDHPVVQVSWNDAEEYCNWAQVRLPTEAQWEKAARGIDGRNYPWTGASFGPDTLNYGDESLNEWITEWIRAGNTGKPAWGKPGNDGYTFTSPVGHYPKGASLYGVMDMAGNVMQWVSDFYQANYYGQSGLINPQGPPPNATNHVYRGGAWWLTQDGNFTYLRNGNYAIYTTDFIGFRCGTSVLP